MWKLLFVCLSLLLGQCLGSFNNATIPSTILTTATSTTIMTSNIDSNLTAMATSTNISGKLHFNETALDARKADDDLTDCIVSPDGVLPCKVDMSPFATCDTDFVPLFAKKSKVTYTVCCNETTYAKGTVYDKSGCGCCATPWQVNCEPAHSVTGCVPDEKHNITQEEVSGVQVCKGEAERNLQRMLKGFGWMMLLWTLCISGFWGL